MSFNGGHPSIGFSLGFTKLPRNDFGVFARGYYRAAQVLTHALLAKSDFPDYEAYPVVFLYRHAFELYLKNIIYKAEPLLKSHQMNDIDSRLYNHHKLPLLAKPARQILLILFPEDLDLKSIADGLIDVACEFSKIDDSSFVYRYPIRIDGNPAVNETQTINLVDLSSRMNKILNQIEVIDFGLDVSRYKAQEINDLSEIMESITSEDEDG